MPDGLVPADVPGDSVPAVVPDDLVPTDVPLPAVQPDMPAPDVQLNWPITDSQPAPGNPVSSDLPSWVLLHKEKSTSRRPSQPVYSGSRIFSQLPDPGGGTFCPLRTVWSVLRPLLEGGGYSQEWTQHWWWDSPAVWAAVPELTSGCSQQWTQHWWWDSPAVWAAVPELTSGCC
ncbi:unnamed protein product [Staurois parvus]|uniref:Uncharacterized protein n=1 Tax=Staurois parvus TaxID=386267 RepID=A0ABN9AXY2_9NEOB|nr:unnamed protein product [Staurois parvus]